jgi:TPR repeat protein
MMKRTLSGLKSAEKDFAQAQFNLALMHLQGKGSPMDKAKTRQLI